MASSSKKGKKARPDTWITENGILLLKAWARDGLTDEDIAHNIGIHRGTLYKWKNRYPEIAEALKEAKEIADIRVENALYKRALGYEYDEVKTVQQIVNGQLQNTAEVTKVHKTVLGDVTAQIIWLKNRRPETWRKGDSRNPEGDDGVEDLAPLASMLKLTPEERKQAEGEAAQDGED